MKRTVLIALVLATAIVLAGTAQAATLTYDVGQYPIQVAAGAEVNVLLSVDVDGLSNQAGLTFLDRISSNNPKVLVTASPNGANVNADSNNATTQLTIHVPADTPPGFTYLAQIFSNIDGGASSNSGVPIRFRVTQAEASCSESPDIGEPSVTPKQIRTPNNRSVDVTITGTISNPEGCDTLNMNYQIDDDAPNSFSINGNDEFTITIPIIASRYGYEKNGRTYEISLSAENEAGTSSRTVTVNVLHDRR